MSEQIDNLKLFDAVEVIRLADNQHSSNARYSHFANQQISVGDVGVVIGDWPNDKLRVEAIDRNHAIVWQDHFDRDQLKLRAPTDAVYSCRRINEHWAWQCSMDGETSAARLSEALVFARNVMLFAKRNLEILVQRLSDSGYDFVNSPLIPPEENIPLKIERLREAGIFVPIALQAWLIEVGGVDFCGTHPQWRKTGYAGLNHDLNDYYEPWYTDPLCIQLSLESLLSELDDGTIKTVDIAPDAVTKANVSGAGPISMHCTRQRFDDVLVGLHGSYTLLSYLRHAFKWGGFPGFSYVHDAPIDLLRGWSEGLTEL